MLRYKEGPYELKGRVKRKSLTNRHGRLNSHVVAHGRCLLVALDRKIKKNLRWTLDNVEIVSSFRKKVISKHRSTSEILKFKNLLAPCMVQKDSTYAIRGCGWYKRIKSCSKEYLPAVWRRRGYSGVNVTPTPRTRTQCPCCFGIFLHVMFTYIQATAYVLKLRAGVNPSRRSLSVPCRLEYIRKPGEQMRQPRYYFLCMRRPCVSFVCTSYFSARGFSLKNVRYFLRLIVVVRTLTIYKFNYTKLSVTIVGRALDE